MSNIHFDFDADHKRSSRMNLGSRRSLIIGLSLIVLIALVIVVYNLFPSRKTKQPKPAVIKTEYASTETVTAALGFKKNEPAPKAIKPVVMTPLPTFLIVVRLHLMIIGFRQLSMKRENSTNKKSLDEHDYSWILF